MPSKLTTEQFIERSKAIHGDRYDYSMAEYQSCSEKISIICLEHGVFEQIPASHFAGCGCPKCGKEQKAKSKLLNPDEFISRAITVHGSKYDYSEADYIGMHKEIKIICRKHGAFNQTACNHLAGKGCPKCGGLSAARLRSLGQDSFILRARSVHGDKYDYSKTKYASAHKKIKIICPKHGEFTQNANDHINGCGCPKCGKLQRAKARSLTQDDFILRSKAVHGDKYDYSKTKYIRSYRKLKIICPIHGEFEQVALDHMLGKGCERCGRQAVGDMNGQNSMGWRLVEWEQAGIDSDNFDGFKLYLVLCGDENTGEYFLKVGRTFLQVKDRFKAIPYKWKEICVFQSDAKVVYDAETKLKKKYRELKTIPSVQFAGRHECFSIAALDSLMTEFEKLNKQSHEFQQ